MKYLWQGLLFLAIIFIAAYAIYEHGKGVGKQQCEQAQVKANGTAQKAANAETKTAIKRANTAGHAQEKNRAAVDLFFDELTRKATHEKPGPVDSCVLPDGRLRIWNAANAGQLDPADQGAATGEPDASAPTPATGPSWDSSPTGSQPSAGGAGVPPVGNTDVRPLDVSGN